MPNFTLGLDLGKLRDHTAVAVVERLQQYTGVILDGWDGPRSEVVDVWHVRHLERYPLGTPYLDVVARVGDLLARPPLRDSTELVIDATGVGVGVLELFTEAYKRGQLGGWWPVPVTITAGENVNGLHVPKVALVSKVEAALANGRLRIAEGLPHGDTLRAELLAFRAKTTDKGNATFEAWRESDHDDLVLALCLAMWRRHRRGYARLLSRDGVTAVDGASADWS